MNFDAKSVIAVLVVAACFGLLGVYVYRGQVPDAVVVAVISGGLNLILGFYFGHANGAQSALATSALNLSNQAIQAATQRRVTDTGPTGATGATGASGAPGAPGPTGPAGVPGTPAGSPPVAP